MTAETRGKGQREEGGDAWGNMFDEEIQIAFFVFAFYMRGNCDWRVLFSQSQPRSFLAIRNCERCLSPSDLAGLLASVVIQKFPSLIPFVVHETDKTIAFKLPFSRSKTHYVIVPKKDIRDVGEISETDVPYMVDAFFVLGQIVRENKLANYRLETNGPGFQKGTYLHFHLVAM